MKKPMFIIIIIAVGLALMVGGYLTYKYWQSRPKIIETRDFSCPGMSGFTFKYPVFKGWEVLSVEYSKSQAKCTILLNDTNLVENGINTEIAPQIQVSVKDTIGGKYSESKEGDKYTIFSYPPNPYGINYIDFAVDSNEARTMAYAFDFTKDKDVIIATAGVPYDKYGFSRDLFFKTVIESFELIISYPYEIKVGKLLDEFGEDKTKFEYAGIITISLEHILTYEADQKYEELIKEAVDEINSRNSLFMESGPPPGSNLRASFSRIVEKKDEDWALVVEENLEKNYRLIKIQ